MYIIYTICVKHAVESNLSQERCIVNVSPGKCSQPIMGIHGLCVCLLRASLSGRRLREGSTDKERHGQNVLEASQRHLKHVQHRDIQDHSRQSSSTPDRLRPFSLQVLSECSWPGLTTTLHIPQFDKASGDQESWRHHLDGSFWTQQASWLLGCSNWALLDNDLFYVGNGSETWKHKPQTQILVVQLDTHSWKHPSQSFFNRQRSIGAFWGPWFYKLVLAAWNSNIPQNL